MRPDRLLNSESGHDMTVRVILPGATIGILGGGQLGRMIAIEGRKMGYDILCLDPTPNCPCAQVADEQIVGQLNDLPAALKLAERSDVLIYEFENNDVGIVEELEKHYYLPQKSRILAVSQDRIQEKQQLHKAGFPVVPFCVIRKADEMLHATSEIGYPSVLKIAKGGYDGKGQLVLNKQDDFNKAYSMVQAAENNAWILEKMVSFGCEISVIVARRETGEISIFPVAENIHRENILRVSVVPARISPLVTSVVTEIAVEVARYFEVVGLLAIEFFVTKQGVLINEMAPRPHNSGHYTLDACYTSQFEQLIRAVCGLPLGSTQLLTPAVMFNILGCDLPIVLNKLPDFSEDVKIHIYGKRGSPLPKRKMGHLIIKTACLVQAEQIIKEMFEY